MSPIGSLSRYGIGPRLALGLAAALVLCITVFIYQFGLPGNFVFDDYGNLINNPDLGQPIHGLADLLRIMLSAPSGGLLRPLSTLSFVLNAQLLGMDPADFKIVNIVIHLCCGAMLWGVALEVYSAYAGEGGTPLSRRTAAWLGLGATALWLVHPLNLTAVLYAIQRDTSLSALFTAASVYAYLIARRRMRQGDGGRVILWVLVPLCVVLGVACKENGVLAPIYMLVAEYTLLDFRGRNGNRREIQAFYGVFLALPIAAITVLALIKPGFFFAGYANRDFTLYERLLTESRVLLDYLRWTFIPDLRQLALYHDDIAASHGLLDPPATLFAIATIFALLIAAFRLRRGYPLLSFGILWFFAGHLLESTVLPLELVFEHRNYLPIFGLLAGCLGTLYVIAGRRGNANLVVTVASVALLVFALTTAMRAMEWQSELNFARSESAHHPQSARSMAELEWAYVAYAVGTHNTAAVPWAVAAADSSKKAEPDGIHQDITLAYMYASLDMEPAASASLHSAADLAKITEASASAQISLQSLLQLTGPEHAALFADMDAVFKSALSNPLLAKRPCYLGQIWNTYALFQNDIGHVPGIFSAMHEATALCPAEPQFRANFATLLLNYGDYKDARTQIDALHGIHDLRYLQQLEALETQYAQQSAPPSVAR